MKKLKEDWLMWVIILIPFVFVVIFWNRFPERIATHFSWDGKPDDYSDKYTGLLLFPCINIALYFFLAFVTQLSPAKFNYVLGGKKLTIVRLITHAFLSLIFISVIFYSLDYFSDINLMVTYSITLLFLILGNYMNSVKRNYFYGIRTPWTLSSEKVWTKTHRLGARIWVGGSLIMLILTPLVDQTYRKPMFISYVIIIAVIPVVYSYLVFRKSEAGSEEN